MDTNAPGINATPAPTQPKKYIRTLAGDMEILKKGGTPDLAPLKESKSPPKKIPTVVAPVTPAPAPVPITVPTPAPPSRNLGFIPEFQVNKPPITPVTPFVAERLEEETPPEPTPPPPPAQATAPFLPTPLETYSSDFSDRMKDIGASSATVLAAEQDSAPYVAQTTAPKSQHNLLYVFAGLMLLIAGGFGVYAAYTHSLNTIPIDILAPVAPTPIFVEEREQISGTGISILQSIEQSIEHNLSSGTVRLLYTENATTTDSSVFSALQLPAPDILLRNLNAAGSMAGVINIAGDQSPFFILSVASYGKTFSGMLSWEPVMTRDLGVLFPAYPAPVLAIPVATSTNATTTIKTAKKTTTASTSSPQATTTIPTIRVGFRDEVFNNHDARIYRDASGRSIILYGYWNQKTLVIARDPAAFVEILKRLASVRTQP